MIKLAVSGAAGRMGKRIIALARENAKLKIIAALDAPNVPSIGKDAGDIAGTGPIGVTVTDDYKAAIASCDVLIDFSSPEATTRNVAEAAKKKKAVVIGTTGLSDEQKAAVNEAALKTRCLLAPI